MFCLGRDPRPVAIAPSGVGVVGTVAGVIEEGSSFYSSVRLCQVKQG